MNQSNKKIKLYKDNNKTSHEGTVIKIVSDHLGIPSVTLTLDTLIEEDLGADSLDKLELMMTIEELFCIKIDNHDIENIKKIADIINCVRKYQNN